jgi:hypothetical protein
MCALMKVRAYPANATITVRIAAFCRMFGTDVNTENSIGIASAKSIRSRAYLAL